MSTPRTPILWSVRPTSTPSQARSTMNAVMESWARLDGSLVLANTVYQSASRTPDIQHFVPLSTHPPPDSSSGTPRVRMPITSLPAWGSDNPKAARWVPSQMPGKYRAFCSSVPAIMTGPVGRRVNSSISAAELEYFATSSMARARPRMPAPEPPYSVGMHSPRRPASRKASKTSAGYAPSLSMARALGFTLSCARRRTEFLSSRSSSGSSKCTGEGYRTSRPGIFWSLTPDQPDSPGPSDATEDHAKSRADLQSELRKSRKKERMRQHRWRRRSIYVLSFIIVLAAIGVGGLYVYANYRFNQIKKVHAKHLVAAAPPGKPFNLLLVGSDSRSFVQNSTQVKAFGDEANAGGQRSDVTMVARFDPAAKTVTVLSIPRDLWVDIPGNDSGISGMNRINAAYDGGPDLLIQTIEQDLGIPINHYVAVDFPGFSGMVNALGGVTMDFPTAVKDQYTGLNVATTGCQVVNGTTALELVRSRHLYYKNSNGYWEGDGLSDFSRIQRQDAFFRAVLAKVNSSITSPLTINAFIGAAVGNLTIDDTLSQGDLLHIADVFRGLPASHLVTETLPTVSYVTSGGADALKVAEPYAQNLINTFNQIGTAPAAPTPTTTQGGKAKATSTTRRPRRRRRQRPRRTTSSSG